MTDLDNPIEILSGVLDTLAKKAPEVISQLIKTIYSPEAGANMGKSVGNFYKELVEAGIPQDVAIKMSGDYMVSIKDILKSMNFQDGEQKKDNEVKAE